MSQGDIRITVFWNVMSCILVNGDHSIRVNCCFHLDRRESSTQ